MSTAFSALVFGNYQKYIPYYIYSIKRNYPNSEIILFYIGSINRDLKDFLKSESNVIFYDNFFSEKADFIKDYKIRGGGNKTLLRYLIPGHYFSKFDAVYFGDVDILIFNEGYNLFDFHKRQADALNLPFSNKVRTLPNSTKLSKRLTGLHFVLVKDYYAKIDSLINQFFSDKKFRDIFMEHINRDEEFLYKLNSLAFNFLPEEVSLNKRPWHGFHLGLVRGRKYLNFDTIGENSSLNISSLKYQLVKLNTDKMISLLLTKFECVEVYNTYKYFGVNLPIRVHINYIFLIYKNMVFKNLKKVKKELSND